MNNVFTFGCRLNFWESEKINTVLKKIKNIIDSIQYM